MLLPPEKENYLARLNARPHPKDICYTSIVTEAHPLSYGWDSLRADAQRLWNGKLRSLEMLPIASDMGRSLLHLCRHQLDADAGALTGDGVVSAVSQDLRHVGAFQIEGMQVQTIKLETGHHQVHRHLNLPELLHPRLPAN